MPTYMWKKEEERKKQRSQKDRRREDGKRASAKEILEVEKGIWKSRVRKNASAKGLGSYNRFKKGFVPKKGKVYSLLRKEQEKVQAFVEDQLQKGYIQPLKSPQTSPVHFVAKKDGK